MRNRAWARFGMTLLLELIFAAWPLLGGPGPSPRSLDAVAALRAGRWTEAAQRAQAAIEQATRAQDAKSLYKNYGYLGAARQRLGQAAAAIRAYESALQGARHTGDGKGQAQYTYALGNLLIGFADTNQAVLYLEEARRLSHQIGEARQEAWAWLRLGEAYDRLGDYEQARAYYQGALDRHQRLGDAEGIGYDYKNLGDFELRIGDYEPAREWYMKAQRWTEEQPLPNPAALQEMIWANLGLIALRRREYPTARAYYEKAQQVGRRGGDPQIPWVIQGQIGTIELRTGQYDAAEGNLRRAERGARRAGQKEYAALWLSRLGEVYFRRGQPTLAEPYYHQALALGQTLRHPQVIQEASQGLGALQEAQGDFAAALDWYDQAITLLEQERNRLVLDQEKAGYLVDKVEAYEKIIRQLAQLHAQNPQGGYARRAFEYAERAKAQAFRQKLPQGVILKYLKEQSAAYRQWEADYQRERAQRYEQLLPARRELDRLQKNPQSDETMKRARQSQILQWERELAERERGHVQFMATQVRRLFPQLRPLYEPEILRMDRVQASLPPGDVLVEYHVQAEKTWAWIIGPTAVEMVELDFGRAQREALMAVLDGVRWMATAKEKQHLRGDALFRGLETFYHQLFAPVEKFIPAGSALVIVPDDLLNFLPFGMLIPARSGGTVQYLAERYAIAYADSAALLGPVRGPHAKTRAAPALDALLVGNPERPGSGAEGLGDLPFAEAEVDAIGPYFRRTLLLKGRAATEAAFKAHAPRAHVIHIAAHHLLDAASPWRSRLVLAPDAPVPGDREDGFLYTFEVFALDLDAELVVLSACDSGSGTLKIGEGLEGTTRAFRFAGARSVLATLWWVDDRASGLVMPRFYSYLAQGLDKRRALQKAQQDLMRAGYTHPHYWACFRLTGDIGPLPTPMRRPAAPASKTVIVSMLLLILLLLGLTVRARRGRRPGR